MADRSIVVRLRAQVDGFKREMAEATKAVDQTAKGTEDAAKRADTAMGRLVQSAQTNRESWTTAGATLTGFGAAAVGGLALATKAAMDWESAWAGVQKTVDGTAPQMAELEQGLRGLARELPASHQEIAAVAEAAGQLGIATPNVLGFTRTMIDLGEATNLSADQAATALARFMNITQTSQADVGRLGASVVGLGNNFATTESEIVDLAMRLAGAGEQAGLTEGEILGMATAMSSVGIEAEAGGTAMSLTMKRIGKAVEEGGDSLGLFAQVSGLTSDEFATAWETRPAEALNAFIEGLSRTEKMGMSTNAVLSELGITGIRESDALLRLSSATDIAADAMALGNEEWDKGTALVQEAAQRYETAESKIAMARNTLVDLGISLGGQVLPALAGLAEAGTDVVGWFADLPTPVQQTSVALGGIAGTASLGAGGFLLLFPRVMDAVGAFRDLRDISPRAAAGLGRVGRAVGVTTAAFAALGAIEAYGDSLTDFSIGANEAADMAMKTADAVDPLQHVFSDMNLESYLASASTQEMAENLDVLANGSFWGSISDKTANLANVFGANQSTLEDSRQRLEEYGQGLAGLAQTDLPAAQEAFSALWEAFGGEAQAGTDLLETMPALREELIRVASSAGLATDDATLLKIASGEIVPTFEEATGAAGAYADGMDEAAEATQSAAEAAEEALTALQELAGEFIDAERGALDYADALEDAAAAAEENGKHWEDGTDAADENKRALLDLADQAWATADALAADGKSGTFLEEARQDLIDTAIEMGMGEEAAKEYVDQLLLTPEQIQTIVDLDTQAAKDEWAALWDELGWHPPQVPVGANTEQAEDDVELFTGTLGDKPPGAVPVEADTGPADDQVWGWRENIEPFEVIVDADTYFGEEQLRKFQSAVTEAGGTVQINGETVYADEALDTLVAEINAGEGTVKINGTPVNAETSLLQLIDIINASGGVVEIDGDPSGANSATDSAKRKADGTTGTIDVDANTSSANSQINSAARNRTAIINVVTTGATSALRAGMRGMSMHATGGAIWGPGTGTSDQVPIWASNGEHMLTAAEVALAGGHDAVYRMRAAIRAGAMRFADGGGIEASGAVRPSAGANSWAWGMAPSAPGPSQFSYAPTIYGPDATVVADRSFQHFRHWADTESTGVRGA